MNLDKAKEFITSGELQKAAQELFQFLEAGNKADLAFNICTSRLLSKDAELCNFLDKSKAIQR